MFQASADFQHFVNTIEPFASLMLKVRKLNGKNPTPLVLLSS